MNTIEETKTERNGKIYPKTRVKTAFSQDRFKNRIFDLDRERPKTSMEDIKRKNFYKKKNKSKILLLYFHLMISQP